jgi:hypothetical protein
MLRVFVSVGAAILSCAATTAGLASDPTDDVVLQARGGDAKEGLPATALWLSNAGPVPAVVTYSFTPARSSVVRSCSETIPPGVTVYRPDVVAELFGWTGIGILRIAFDPGVTVQYGGWRGAEQDAEVGPPSVTRAGVVGQAAAPGVVSGVAVSAAEVVHRHLEIVRRPSSEELIDAALAAGQISQEMALVDKVLATFGDSRLPVELKGDDSLSEDGARLTPAQLASLSAQGRATVAPFLLPPSAPGSWIALPTVGQSQDNSARAQATAASTWTTYLAVGGKVKVWAQDRYPGDAAKAQLIAAAITAKIWPALTGLLGNEHLPWSDGGLKNNGGDAAFDIYLVHFGSGLLGLTNPIDPANSCQLNPDFVLLDSRPPVGDETHPGVVQTTVHELFHAFQDTFPLATGCYYPEYLWFFEASAMWSEDYVYPNAQSEHPRAEDLLHYPQNPLDSEPRDHWYGDYLFPFYLAREMGNPLLVKGILLAFKNNTSSLDAIEQALSLYGGLEKIWPEFTLDNWNKPPVDDYRAKDGLTQSAFPDGGQLDPGQSWSIRADLGYLSAEYADLSFTDEVRSVTYENPGVGLEPAEAVWAVLKIDGQWQAPEDWTMEPLKYYCRDKPSENLEELVVIVSNSDTTRGSTLAAGDPTVRASGIGCAGWTGTAHATIPGAWGTETSAAQVTFVLDPVNSRPNTNYDHYVVKEGVVTWSLSGGSFGNCTVTGGPLTVPIARNDGVIDVAPGPPAWYSGYGGTAVNTTITLACPSGTQTLPYIAGLGGWFAPDANSSNLVSADGKTIAGSSVFPGGAVWDWSFQAVGGS